MSVCVCVSFLWTSFIPWSFRFKSQCIHNTSPPNHNMADLVQPGVETDCPFRQKEPEIWGKGLQTVSTFSQQWQNRWVAQRGTLYSLIYQQGLWKHYTRKKLTGEKVFNRLNQISSVQSKSSNVDQWTTRGDIWLHHKHRHFATEYIINLTDIYEKKLVGLCVQWKAM